MKLNFNNIIVRMPNWIGDLVMATPVLTDLRKAFPNAHITAMCRAPISDLLIADSDIDELFCFNKSHLFVRRNENRNIIEKLRQGKYDLGLLLTHSFSSAWSFWQGRVTHRVGYECNGRRLLLTHPIVLEDKIQNRHLVNAYKMLLEPLGIPLSSTAPRLYLQEKEINEARELLKQQGITSKELIVGINPGATYGSAKCWLPERFREVTHKLIQNQEIAVVYFGDVGSEGLVEEICRGFSSKVVNLAGLTSLRELSCLISLCDLLLTNDSGPMHIADAVGTPIVALFGSTNERVTGPYKKGVVIHKHVECSPCYQRTCPIDFRCMKRIESEEVYEQIMMTLRDRFYA